jgi:toxin CcdB
MSQFDIFENTGRSKSNIPFVLDVQSGLVSGALSTRIVVPLYKSSLIKRAALKIHVPVTVAGRKCIALFDELASVPASVLGRCVANVDASLGRDCRVALDVLFFNQP